MRPREGPKPLRRTETYLDTGNPTSTQLETTHVTVRKRACKPTPDPGQETE